MICLKICVTYPSKLFDFWQVLLNPLGMLVLEVAIELVRPHANLSFLLFFFGWFLPIGYFLVVFHPFFVGSGDGLLPEFLALEDLGEIALLVC